MIGFIARSMGVLAVATMCTSSVWGQRASADQEIVRPGPTRSVFLLDSGWSLYKLPDFQLWPAEPEATEAQIHELHLPAPGNGWRTVELPNDYVVGGTISRNPNPAMLASGAVCPLGARECDPPGSEPVQGKPGDLNRPGRDAYAGHGYLPLYPAWYRRDLTIDPSAKGKRIWLDFGGVYRDAIVFVNGQYTDQHASGYTGFRLDITRMVNFGEKNTIAVFVDPRWFEGWWYEGGGIYRHVKLIAADPLQVSPWGTFVNADVQGVIESSPAGDSATAKLTIQTTVRNDGATSRKFTLVSRVIDERGKTVATTSSKEELTPDNEQTFSQTAMLQGAHLWSLEHRNLYRLVTELRSDAKPVDEESTTFGVRKLRFDPDKGFFLNDKRVEIRGMCVHQDFPGLGVGAPDNLWAWRMDLLKKMGANAIRTAHGADSEGFYDQADRMGMLVMAENRHLGDTYFPKANDATGYSDLADLKALVMQERNHPSIIMWSMSNEEGEGGKPQGRKIFAAMKDSVRKYDPSRPVTAAINGHFTPDSFIPLEDALGMNYHNAEFEKIHAEFPNLMIYGSEDGNAKTSRGTVETSRPMGLCSEYGCEASLDGGPWRSWTPVIEHAFVAGEFVWTGFDYRGEPNPFSWPAVTSQVGAMDITGAPKPVYYYWQTAWHEKPAVYLFPEWDLPASNAGKDVLVRAFSNCDRVELFLNGKSLGAQDVPRDLYIDWHVPYAPGTLTAVAYKQGREVARYTDQTAGAPVALRLIAEVPNLMANGEDIAPIRVAVVDADGKVVPDANNLIHFSVSGNGVLAGVANGNPTSHEPDVADQREAFHGLAMVLVKADGEAGSITVEAKADGLPPAHIVVSTIRAATAAQSGR
ncbi:MAG TPA: glycoside hydrolase family 2 TIM barrel-domain containing protein [Bryocella sp.]|nr:glycoside hydrolase family 2 TIM barrel-domain containing protein [Bryocella sp.]